MRVFESDRGGEEEVRLWRGKKCLKKRGSTGRQPTMMPTAISAKLRECVSVNLHMVSGVGVPPETRLVDFELIRRAAHRYTEQFYAIDKSNNACDAGE